MAKRTKLSSDSKQGVKNTGKVEELKESSPVYVPLRLRIPATYVTYGNVSGEKYVFRGAGSVVNVLEEDASGFLAKRTQVSCCNGTPPQNIFEQVGE